MAIHFVFLKEVTDTPPGRNATSQATQEMEAILSD